MKDSDNSGRGSSNGTQRQDPSINSGSRGICKFGRGLFIRRVILLGRDEAFRFKKLRDLG